VASSPDDLVRARVIQRIMCRGSVVFAEIAAESAIDFHHYFAPELAALVPMERDGLLEVTDQDLRVTPAGRFLLRNVAMVFDAYLKAASVTSFSKTV